MIKLTSLCNRILESKNVGDVYHFTGWFNLLKIVLIDNKIKLTTTNIENIPGVSTTRDKFFNRREIDNGVVISVALKLDGNKLSEKYQVKPHNDARTPSTKYYGDEMEELWYGKQLNRDGGIYPIWKYLKEIIISDIGMESLSYFRFGYKNDDDRMVRRLLPGQDNPTDFWYNLRTTEKFDIIADLFKSKGVGVKVQ